MLDEIGTDVCLMNGRASRTVRFLNRRFEEEEGTNRKHFLSLLPSGLMKRTNTVVNGQNWTPEQTDIMYHKLSVLDFE